VVTKLQHAVSKPALVVCQVLQKAGHEAYVVGGCVRDALIGRPVSDWDVTTDALPEQVMKLFKRTIPTGVQHGTVTVIESGVHVEVTTYRGEGAYTDARRPDSVTFGVPLTRDLERRDFTVNAMAWDPHNQRLVDPHDGQGDLAAGLLRAVGDPADRFREDGLRVMRAVRFVATLELDLDPATEAAIAGALPSLAKVSAERVRDELLKLLGARQPSRGLVVAERTGALAQILPERTEAVEIVDGLRADALLRFAALLAHGDRHAASSVGRRLKLSNDERQRVTHMVEHQAVAYDPAWTDADVRRWVAAVQRERVADALDLRAAVTGELPDLRARAQGVIDAGDPLYPKELALGGEDVMRILGKGQGRHVGRALDALLEQVFEDPSKNDAATLEKLLRSAS